MKHFLKLLRWQQNLDGPHSLFEIGPTLYWKIVGETYTYVAVQSHAGQLPSVIGIKLEEVEEAELQSLGEKADADEPLAHELLCEAKTLLGTSARNALLVTVAALEAGVKHHVGLLAPETAWLLSEMPSPPVFRLLRDYIPILYRNRGTELEHWPNSHHLFRACQKLAEDRNELTHTGQMICDTATVERYMYAVSDVLSTFSMS